MNIVYSDMPLPQEVRKSVFLAGPSPRDKETFDWKKEAVKILYEIGFDGTVYIPVPKGRFEVGADDDKEWTPENQIDWEVMAREAADILIFWVPRNIEGKMPGFTTNIEFGEDLHSGRVLYGRPDIAQKCRYMDIRFTKKGPVYNDLKVVLLKAKELLGNGVLRQGVEVHIPKFVFEHDAFSSWYADLKQSGNKLVSARVLFTDKKGVDKKAFCVVLQASVWVHGEGRVKENEHVYFRFNTVSVVPYFEDDNGVEHVVLVREFRTAVSNAEGYVYEFPGGSSWDTEGESQVLMGELTEELGLTDVQPSQLKRLGARQVAATLAGFKQVLYKLALSESQVACLKKMADSKQVLGADEGEVITLKVLPVSKLLSLPVDYSTLGAAWWAFGQGISDSDE